MKLTHNLPHSKSKSKLPNKDHKLPNKSMVTIVTVVSYLRTSRKPHLTKARYIVNFQLALE